MQTVNKPACVVALGFFDGVHIGHRAVMEAAVKRAGELNMKSCVFSFDIRPRDFLFNEKSRLITPDLRQKEAMIKRYSNIDDVIFLHFDDKMASLTYEQFIRNILVKKYNVKHIVIGENYTCGKGGRGDAAAVLALCIKLGIGCDVIKSVCINGETVSSTKIRSALENNDVHTAVMLMGHDAEKETKSCVPV